MMRRAVMTTSWDDGHPLDFRLADLLVKHGLTGTFYIPRQAENVTMTVSQVRELSRSFEIGAHTMQHTFLNGVTELTAEREITESKGWVEDITGKQCTLFCPPGGKFDHRHLRMVKAAGYTGMRSVELLSLAEPAQQMGIQILPTTIQAHPHGRGTYIRNAVKRGAVRNLWKYVMNGSETNWVALAENLMREVAEEGGVFHLWGHSWEIEKNGQWKNLEKLLGVMGQYAMNIPCVTNWELCARRDTVQSAGVAMRVGA